MRGLGSTPRDVICLLQLIAGLRSEDVRLWDVLAMGLHVRMMGGGREDRCEDRVEMAGEGPVG